MTPEALQILSASLAFFLLLLVPFTLRYHLRASIARQREEALQQEISRLQTEENRLQTELADLRATETLLLRRQTELETRLSTEKERRRETEDFLDSAGEHFTHTFKALSHDALRASQEQFLQLARSTFRNEQQQAEASLETREQAVAHLVKPVAETLDQMQRRLRELEKAREGAYAGLHAQVKTLTDSQLGLREETAQLVKALRQPTGRGQWGEIQLQRVVELAGMTSHCDFVTQVSTSDTEGKRLRPDLVVQLPGGRQIIVDAKTPMDAFLNALEAKSDEDRTSHLQRHARQVATHIRQLASKNYQAHFQPAPEFVILFLPSESFFSAALAEDPTLIEQGVERDVILATPTTLIALLRSIAHGWRQETLASNAAEICEAGRDLHKRLTTFSEHLQKLGQSFDRAIQSYNAAVNSLESRVLPAARKFEDLEVNERHLTTAAPEEINRHAANNAANDLRSAL